MSLSGKPRFLSRLTPRVSSFSHRITPKKTFLAAALLLAVAAAWPILSHAGLLNTRGGGDSPFLLQRVHQLATALGDGHFPVRWMPDANYGYGYPFYNYYAPLSIYIASAFRLLGFDFIWSIQLSQLLGFMVAAWGMFLLARRWLRKDWAALLSAAAYTLAPFHMVNVYVRGDSLAEFWAMAFFPLVLLAIDRLFQATAETNYPGQGVSDIGPKGAMAILALSYTALILSHNISALIFTPMVILYLLIVHWPFKASGRDQNGSRFRFWKWTLVALVLALTLSAWFWLPALGESSLAQLEPVTSGYFHFSNHFRGSDLIQPNALFDYDEAGGRAFRMGLVQAIAIVLGLVLLVTASLRKNWPANDMDTNPKIIESAPSRISKPVILYILTGLVVATLMITPLSRPLWENLPLLSFTQFPWRFLSVQAFFGALVIGALAFLPGRRIIVPVAIGLLLLAGLGNLQTDFLILNDADVTAERLAEYEWYTANIGSTISAEYLPQTVQPRSFTSPWLNNGERYSIQQLDGQIISNQLISTGTTSQMWQITAAESGARIAFPTMFWPGWEATIDGLSSAIEPAPGSSLITLEVPAGNHEVRLRLTRTPIRLAAEIVSLLAVLGLLWIVKPASFPKLPPHLIYILLAGLLLAAILWLWPLKSLPADDMTWDFAQMAYLHHDSAGVTFDNGAELQSYSYNQEEVLAGDELIVTLQWRKASPGEATLDLTTPAVNRFELAPLLIGQSQPVTANQVEYIFTIPETGPAGLYVPRLTIPDAQPVVTSGRTRGELFLRPFQIIALPQPADPQPADLDARAGQISLPEPNYLEVQLQWLTQKPLTQNYNFSLRLADAGGIELAQFDGQPGYGFQPSSGWSAGQWVNDWLALPLPDDLQEKHRNDGPLALIVRLYDVETGNTVLTRRLGDLVFEDDKMAYQPHKPSFTIPDGLTPVRANFDDIIQLRSYELSQLADGLELTLYWEALVDGSEEFFHFVHLVDPATGEIVAQHDSMPGNNSYPTGQWSAGEIVADPLFLDLTEMPSVEYILYVGLYRNLGIRASRLPASDDQGKPLPDDRFLLPDQILIDP